MYEGEVEQTPARSSYGTVNTMTGNKEIKTWGRGREPWQHGTLETELTVMTAWAKWQQRWVGKAI